MQECLAKKVNIKESFAVKHVEIPRKREITEQKRKYRKREITEQKRKYKLEKLQSEKEKCTIETKGG